MKRPKPEIVPSCNSIDKLSVCAFCKQGAETEDRCGTLHLSEEHNFAAHHKCMVCNFLCNWH